jgi:uncharacterized membrane protein YvbJ
MIQCKACGRENPDDAAFCNKCGAALGIANQPGRTIVVPAREKTLVLPGLASTTVLTKSDLNIRIFIEVIFAIACIIGGFLIGQPWWGLGLGLVALGFGYIVYLFSTEAS